MTRLRTLGSYAALLAAVAGDPLVALEVGPELIAAPLSLGSAVLFARESQRGEAGAVALGPAADVDALLRSPWPNQPGWATMRSITLQQPLRPILHRLGVEHIGTWATMSIRPGQLTRRPLPDGVRVDLELARDQAIAFIRQHHSTRWVSPESPGEQWVGLRDSATGAILGTGLAAFTPAGATRLSSIVIDQGQRGRGFGWAVTQQLVDLGVQRSPAVVLGVDADNHVGRALYAGLGFGLDHELVSGVWPPRG